MREAAPETMNWTGEDELGERRCWKVFPLLLPHLQRVVVTREVGADSVALEKGNQTVDEALRGAVTRHRPHRVVAKHEQVVRSGHSWSRRRLLRLPQFLLNPPPLLLGRRLICWTLWVVGEGEERLQEARVLRSFRPQISHLDVLGVAAELHSVYGHNIQRRPVGENVGNFVVEGGEGPLLAPRRIGDLREDIPEVVVVAPHNVPRPVQGRRPVGLFEGGLTMRGRLGTSKRASKEETTPWK